MFENKPINGIHATRYIMSWVREGGSLKAHGEGYVDFREWLRSLGLSDEDIKYIVLLAMEGKLELEVSARKFMKTLDG